MTERKISILGTEYTVKTGVKLADDALLNERAGYCDFTNKVIATVDLHTVADWADEPEHGISIKVNQTLRHEIIHAHLYESGLWMNAASSNHWAENEEMVDWFAMQWPKMLKAMQDADGL